MEAAKHINVAHKFAMEMSKKGLIKLRYIRSEANTADVLTKALGAEVFERHCEALGVVWVNAEKQSGSVER